ncbi:hypothetical protein TRFO_27000 [Tritrichomonas foetus]|uniref:Anaphase-promoting complex subunit 4 WD40 domain-containing protein n=1 Tax=Tritrichomonas foetus TaxID=1144522 RepID=A0A1J4K1N7_9EUKA|nr:hypothetical protein TRFO_27000 [Tritrichomonas foetus]|eukprot:OHT05303.1 hypothetical protein TRFO_27000 [Tritrichomonas foetus]
MMDNLDEIHDKKFPIDFLESHMTCDIKQLIFMSKSVNHLDPALLLKNGTEQSAIDDFERFVQSYIELHDKYNFSMIKRIDESPFKVGFLEDIYHFYASTNAGLIFYATNPETGENSEMYRFTTSHPIQCVSQNPDNPYLFALIVHGSITLLNYSTKISKTINLEKSVIQVSWVTDNYSNSSLVCLNRDLTVGIVDIQNEKFFTSTTKLESTNESHFLAVHPTRNLAAVCDERLRIIDFRDSPKIREFALKEEATSISWLPSENFGCAIGFSDGDIEFFSFISDSVVMSQNLTNKPLNSIEFCPSNPSSVSIVVENNIIFASLPAWGFGNLGRVATYRAHLSPILDAHWTANDENASMITCDADHTIHIFDVPDEYMPLYEPE